MKKTLLAVAVTSVAVLGSTTSAAYWDHQTRYERVNGSMQKVSPQIKRSDSARQSMAASGPKGFWDHQTFYERVDGRLQKTGSQSGSHKSLVKATGSPARKGQWDHQTYYELSNGAIQKVGVSSAAAPDIVETAVAAGSFNTLVTAVEAAGLVEVLKGDGPFTVFAPSDAAFEKLPEGALEGLLADKEKLAAVLKYHVVPGRLDSGKVTSMSSLPTAQGGKLPVDSLKIAKTDIATSNGIIHVIDEVLIPQS